MILLQYANKVQSIAGARVCACVLAILYAT